MLRIFQVAQKHDLDIHPETLRAVTRNLKHVDKALRENPKASALFIEMLTSEKDPETTLRRLNEAGRSEEHTSELQSLMRISYAVLCLKNTKLNTQTILP